LLGFEKLFSHGRFIYVLLSSLSLSIFCRLLTLYFSGRAA
jgi:hypothetical protein